MNIFQLGLKRIAELVADYFLSWKTAELENLSERSLEDIGLDPLQRGSSAHGRNGAVVLH
jgi:hypothetical protein